MIISRESLEETEQRLIADEAELAVLSLKHERLNTFLRWQQEYWATVENGGRALNPEESGTVGVWYLGYGNEKVRAFTPVLLDEDLPEGVSVTPGISVVNNDQLVRGTWHTAAGEKITEPEPLYGRATYVGQGAIRTQIAVVKDGEIHLQPIDYAGVALSPEKRPTFYPQQELLAQHNS